MEPSADALDPRGETARAAGARRRRTRPGYAEASDEYAAIRELRKRNWIAAHIRERRYELDMTQDQVAKAARTSHSFISKLERGDSLPTLPVLNSILAALGEDLLIGIQPRNATDESASEIAPLPVLEATMSR